MNLKDAARSIIRSHEKDPLTPLSTVWGESLNKKNVLPEYPRPQLRRDSFLSLNGFWDYAITPGDTPPAKFDGQLLVPFSPESTLSGACRQLRPSETLWYHRMLPALPTPPDSGVRTILHFGAVDYQTEVFINGSPAISHRGGYLPFHVDITDMLHQGDNLLLLKVQDPTDQGGQPRGKQSLKRGGIFYTAQSGIWQSVWIEQIPEAHLESVWFETDYDARQVTAHITATAGKELPPLCLSVLAGDMKQHREALQERLPQSPREILRQSLSLAVSGEAGPDAFGEPFARRTSAAGEGGISPEKDARIFSASLSFTIPEEAFHSWSPEDPFLYQVRLSLGEDRAESYFAMRLYTIESPEGTPVFCLNHRPYFLMGVLDQGYWPEGLYTAPSDEALLYDITAMKKLGFNLLRKHLKVESARWYYHCDRLGMIVCQDMVNGGGRYRPDIVSYLPTLSRRFTSHLKDSRYDLLAMKNPEHRRQWEQECLETVDYLKFFPSIAIWTAFNEGWGQFDAARITALIRKADPSRLVDSASGWFDQGCGDFVSVHNYFRPLTVPEKDKRDGRRAFFLSEYGGFACHIREHSSLERVFGYKRYDSLADFGAAYGRLIEKSLLPLKEQGLSGAVYTQLSDVEEEVNGLLTYDRKVNKLSPAPSPVSEP